MIKKRIFLALLTLVVLAPLVGIGLSVLIYNQTTQVVAHCNLRPDDKSNTPNDFKRQDFDTTPYLMTDYETVTFPSRDQNIQISGWYIEPVNGKNKGTVIIVHGIHDCKQRDFALTAAGMLHKHDFTVLLIDMRNHGESTVTDGRQTAGTKEYRDVLGAWDWLVTAKTTPPQSIGLMGFSLGGATVLIASGEEPQVAAVWTDSSFARINDIVDDGLSRLGIPSFMTTSSLSMGEIMTEHDITAKTPLEAVKKLNGRALFIVHGTQDPLVDVRYADALVKATIASGNAVEPWLVEDAAHIGSIFKVPDDYEENLVDFFEANLTSPQ